MYTLLYSKFTRALTFVNFCYSYKTPGWAAAACKSIASSPKTSCRLNPPKLPNQDWVAEALHYKALADTAIQKCSKPFSDSEVLETVTRHWQKFTNFSDCLVCLVCLVYLLIKPL